ncbi:MAG: ribonuclease III [Rhodothermales bacterium]|nr:ribonuclease III [Rhodothermales bacterium]
MSNHFINSVQTFFRRWRVSESDEQGAALEVSAATLEKLQAIIGRKIVSPEIYSQALRHRSLLRRRHDSRLVSNERLEYLGDAVLGFIVAEYLFHQFPGENEGFLTRLRSKLVKGEALARYAGEIELGKLILMSANMKQMDGEGNSSILANAYEAIIGAIYLDLGVDAARVFIDKTMLQRIDLVHLSKRTDNYKSILLEAAQARSWKQPEYVVTHESGPSHDRTFTVDVIVNGDRMGSGTAANKKKAQQLAAREAIEAMRS